jgi:hypothetical protein
MKSIGILKFLNIFFIYSKLINVDLFFFNFVQIDIIFWYFFLVVYCILFTRNYPGTISCLRILQEKARFFPCHDEKIWLSLKFGICRNRNTFFFAKKLILKYGTPTERRFLKGVTDFSGI